MCSTHSVLQLMNLSGFGAGGFNQPIMCGGEPRVMTKKERGSQCVPFFYIKINLPRHGKSVDLVLTWSLILTITIKRQT